MWDVIVYDPNPSTPTEPDEPTTPDEPDGDDDCHMGIHHYEIEYEYYDSDKHKVIHDCIYCKFGDYYKLEDHIEASDSGTAFTECPSCGQTYDERGRAICHIYRTYCMKCNGDELAMTFDCELCNYYEKIYQ